MSIRVMNRVWEHAPYKESTLLILLALADFADDHGICWPEIPALAAKARVSERRAIDIIQALDKDGAIVFKRGGGRGRRSLYGVLVGLSDEQKEKVKEFHRNYFTENKTVKYSAKKGEIQRKEKVNYSVNSHTDSAQQDAPNPDPIRHIDPSIDPSVRESGKKDANSPARTPALIAYFEVFPDYSPSAAQVQEINEKVTDITRWRAVLKEWKLNDWNKRSIGRMVNRYESGTTMSDERPLVNNGASNRQAPAAPVYRSVNEVAGKK